MLCNIYIHINAACRIIEHCDIHKFCVTITNLGVVPYNKKTFVRMGKIKFFSKNIFKFWKIMFVFLYFILILGNFYR
jgi:hypothetical protein